MKTKRVKLPVIKRLKICIECPNCGSLLEIVPESIFTSVNEGFDLLRCPKCGKLYQLAFRELVEE